LGWVSSNHFLIIEGLELLRRAFYSNAYDIHEKYLDSNHKFVGGLSV